MSDQFLGQIMLVPYTFAPYGWAFCQGQLLPIAQNTALFSLLGTAFGGDGRSTFALPNLQGNIPIGQGQGQALPYYLIGETGGAQNVTLLATEMPIHAHVQQGTSGEPTSSTPIGNNFGELARTSRNSFYVAPPDSKTSAQMNFAELQVAGNNQAHSNMQPYLVLNYVIALTGVYPPRS
jgi:microcystin-dependent protein